MSVRHHLALWCALFAATSASAQSTKRATRPQITFGTLRYSFAAISPNGQQVLTNEKPIDDPIRGGEAALLWDLETGQIIRRFEGHTERVQAGAFSPDGAQVITGGGTSSELGPARDTALRLWDVASGRETRRYRGHKDRVTSVCFSADGKQILSLSFMETARLWDMQSGRELFAWPQKGAAQGASLSADGRRVLTMQYSPLYVWDTVSGKEIAHVREPGVGSSFTAAHFGPDARLVASASFDKTARVWEADTGKEVRVFAGHTSYVNQARFSVDGKWLVTGSSDKTARIWEVATGKEVRSLAHMGCVKDVHLSPDSTRLVTLWLPEQGGSRPYFAGISLWDTKTGEELRRVATRDDQCRPRPPVFTPDGKSLLVHVERTELMDVETGKTGKEYE